MPDPSLLIAHQGGWDEILLVVVPIVLIVALLAVAKRRVGAANTDASRASASASAPVGSVDGDD